MHMHLIRTRIYMRIHIYAYPLASERKPASGLARLAAQGRKDGQERVNPILKKIQRERFLGKFFKKIREGNFQEISEKPIFRTLGNRILICGRKSREKKIRKSLKALSTVDFCRRSRKSRSDIYRRRDRRKRANICLLAQPRQRPADRLL